MDRTGPSRYTRLRRRLPPFLRFRFSLPQRALHSPRLLSRPHHQSSKHLSRCQPPHPLPSRHQLARHFLHKCRNQSSPQIRSRCLRRLHNRLLRCHLDASSGRAMKLSQPCLAPRQLQRSRRFQCRRHSRLSLQAQIASRVLTGCRMAGRLATPPRLSRRLPRTDSPSSQAVERERRLPVNPDLCPPREHPHGGSQRMEVVPARSG